MLDSQSLDHQSLDHQSLDHQSLSHAILVNLSFVGKKPTGLATYAINLVPHLHLPGSLLLASNNFPATHLTDRPHYEIPNNLTPEQGKRGHFQRLWWTQVQLAQIYTQTRSQLIFSLVPEAPINSSCRSIVVVHDLIPLRFPNWRSPLTYYFRYYIPQVLHRSEHILCNSIATANDVQTYYGISPQRITPIPLAHDAQHFRIMPSEQLPPPPARPYFFYVGRHDPYKNLHTLIQAFAAFAQQDSQESELWIAGSSDRRYTPQLQQQAQALGVGDRVRWLGYVSYEQLPILLNQAIAMVFPSFWEGFGFPVLEAMACGTPVITSNLSSLPEVAGDAAILVDPQNKAELTAALRSVTEATTQAQLRSAGLARSSQFSWQKTGAATAEILQRFL